MNQIQSEKVTSTVEEKVGTIEFKVYILNDNVTTFDCVIDSLMIGFKLNRSRAEQIAIEADREGEAFVGKYYYSMAVHRITKAKAEAARHGFDLKFRVD